MGVSLLETSRSPFLAGPASSRIEVAQLAAQNPAGAGNLIWLDQEVGALPGG
jgi:hypothetical protein